MHGKSGYHIKRLGLLCTESDTLDSQNTSLTTIPFVAFITTVIVAIATLHGRNTLKISASKFFRRAPDIAWNLTQKYQICESTTFIEQKSKLKRCIFLLTTAVFITSVTALLCSIANPLPVNTPASIVTEPFISPAFWWGWGGSDYH